LSFDADKLVENANVIINAIRAERPSAAKGVYIRKLAVSSTMGVPVKVAIKE
jgi:large subunit ribosomal protein L1